MQVSNDRPSALRPFGTRRDFVAALLAAPAAVALVSSSRVRAQPSNGVVVRKEISTLDPAELQVLRNAVRIMKERPDSDPTSWAANASIHDQFCSTGDVNRQIHFSWWFLPWHRAYLHFTETKLQAAVNEPNLALPFWDWNRTPELHPNYLGGDNPLSDDTRERKPDETIPPDFRDLTLLRVPLFSLCGGDAFFPGVNPARPGLLELSPHNVVHGWVGGNMARFDTAALDPIFFGHHGNIDRLWQVWLNSDPNRRNPPNDVWLERMFVFTDADGLPVEIAVRDLLDTDSLGYRYDDVGFAFAAAAAETEGPPATSSEVAVRLAAPRDDQPNVLGADPVTVPVTTPEQAPVLAALSATGPKIVVLQIEGLEVPRQPVVYRVYLNRPDADAATPTDPEAGYLGNFSVIPLGEDGARQVITARVVLPETALDALAVQEQNAVTIVPVSVTGGPAEPIQVPFENLSLTIEN